MQNKHIDLRTLTQLALLVAIELVMKATGLGSVPVGPLYMSFLTLPIAVGAMLLGPGAGAVLGAVFGLVSFKDAVTGVSAMTGSFFQISPLHTLILCVATRVLMGYCCGLLYKLCRKADSIGSWSYTAGALSAPLLNTLFFMSSLVLLFGNTEYIQKLMDGRNVFVFICAFVGINAVCEMAASTLLTGAIGSALIKAKMIKLPAAKTAAE